MARRSGMDGLHGMCGYAEVSLEASWDSIGDSRKSYLQAFVRTDTHHCYSILAACVKGWLMVQVDSII